MPDRVAAPALHCFYGGTFDPVHNGHLGIARVARDQLQTTVRLLPAADPPHRPAPGADAGQRARMLELAIEGQTGLAVDRREIDREGLSYTVDTLRQLRAELGATQPLALLVGADSFVSLPEWREWRALFGLAHFVVAERSGTELVLEGELAAASAGRRAQSAEDLKHRPAGLIFGLHQPLLPESASEVRQRIADGRPWRHLLPAAVAAFIEVNRLYTRSATAGPL